MQATKRVKNPGKQRKMLFNAPAHVRHKLMAAPLSPELLAQKGIKTLPVRKGDTIRVMRGDHKGFEGKVSRVDLKNYRVYLEGLTREKVDGTTVFVGLHPSKVMIKNLNLDDKQRKTVLDRKKPIVKKKVEQKKAPVVKKVTEAKKTAKAEEEKPVAATEEIISEEKPKAKPAKKPSVKKIEETEAEAAEEAPSVKEEQPKAAKKPAAKRKTTPPTEGGT